MSLFIYREQQGEPKRHCYVGVLPTVSPNPQKTALGSALQVFDIVEDVLAAQALTVAGRAMLAPVRNNHVLYTSRDSTPDDIDVTAECKPHPKNPLALERTVTLRSPRVLDSATLDTVLAALQEHDNNTSQAIVL